MWQRLFIGSHCTHSGSFSNFFSQPCDMALVSGIKRRSVKAAFLDEPLLSSQKEEATLAPDFFLLVGTINRMVALGVVIQ